MSGRLSVKYNVNKINDGQQRPQQQIEHKMLANIINKIVKDTAH